DHVLRNHGELSGLDLDASLAQPFLHLREARHARRDDELIVGLLHVLRADLERGHERALLVVALRVDVDLPLPVELPGDGAARAEGAAVLVHREAEIRDGPVRVVGQRLDIERSTAMAVPLVRDLLVLDALELARALLDGALDVLRGHVRGLRRVDGEAQPRIHPRIAATGTRRDRDLADQLRELLPPTSVVDRLLALDLRPFAVS